MISLSIYHHNRMIDQNRITEVPLFNFLRCCQKKKKKKIHNNGTQIKVTKQGISIVPYLCKNPNQSYPVSLEGPGRGAASHIPV